MTRKEAIKVAHEMRGWLQTDREREALEILIPELRESEDERIRKKLINIVSSYYGTSAVDPERDECITWLEKQKESLHIPETCKENPDSFIDEDERIRKVLIHIVKGSCDKYGIKYKGDITQEQMLAYLEKQKEQNHDGKKWIFEDEYQKDLDRLYNEGKDEVLNNPAKYGLQKEQKPALTPERIHPKFAVGDTVCRPMWSDHTIREIYVRCNDPEYVCVNEEGTESHISFSEQDEWERKEQKPTEWSEEDETRLKVIKKELERFIMLKQYGTPLSVDDISWLELLPERFSLQPKQEWSEKDEKMLRSCCAAIIYDNSFTYDERCAMEDWLKGRFNLLCPVKQEWSEEDIENGSYISAFLQANCENNEILKKATTWFMSRFKSLYPVKQEWSDEDAEKAAREYADENPGMMHENDGSVVDDYDTPYYNFLAGYRWTKSHIHPVNTIEQGEEDTKMRTCDKLEMEKLYGEEY